ncbi:hypothetical protein SASPL_143866 [Salvia splendens]|uniref:CREG-like beta-barrel domain-containing protein n=1 Tax=Salvia splendens TaxID=180675 RepID=A0A8X8WPN9_SALSN|nr:hypothetical protein SASPL_143866 [Salvia splendens]
MEALSSSSLQIKMFSDRSSAIQTAKISNKHCAVSKVFPSFTKKQSLRCVSRVSAVASDHGEEDSRLDSDNGVVRFVSDETLSLSEGNSPYLQQSGLPDINLTTPPLMGSYGTSSGGGTRAGLFRTPISGGVQSATSAHGLPRPALAVRNLMEQTPGWSGLSNARVTIFGDVYPLPEDQQEWAHKQYIEKHLQGPSQKWGNFYYFRMQNISDIYFIGGFGTVAWVDVKEYEDLRPDQIAVDGGEQNLKELNAIFSKPLRELLSKEAEEVDDAAFISIDSRGVDIRVRQGAQFNVQRISFEDGQGVETLEEAKKALWGLMNGGRMHNLQK